MKNNLEIGNRIRKLREELHMTRNTFSEQIDISETYLAQIERGEKNPTLRIISAVCYFTDCSADYLLFGKEDEDNNKKKRLIRLIDHSPESSIDLYYDVLHSIKAHFNN